MMAMGWVIALCLLPVVGWAEVRESALRKELLRRDKADQAPRKDLTKLFRALKIDSNKTLTLFESDVPARYRARFQDIVRRMAAVDADNRAWFAGVLDRYGWPGKSMVGEEAAVSAWLIEQHSDNDLAFQKRCAEMMGAMPVGEVDEKRLASLRERVASHLGNR